MFWWYFWMNACVLCPVFFKPLDCHCHWWALYDVASTMEEGGEGNGWLVSVLWTTGLLQVVVLTTHVVCHNHTSPVGEDLQPLYDLTSNQVWFSLLTPNIMEVVNVSTSLGCFHGSIKGSSSTACGRVSVGWPDLSNQNLKDYHSGLRKTPCVFCHYLKGTILLWFSVENRLEYRFPCGLTVWPVTFSSRFFLPWCQPFPEPYRQLQVSAVVAEKPSLARCLSRQVDADP